MESERELKGVGVLPYKRCEACDEAKPGSKTKVTPDGICLYTRWWCYDCQEERCCRRMMIEFAA